MLRRRGALRHSRRRLLQAPALAIKLEQVPVMQETVEERGDDDGVAEQARPVFDGAVLCGVECYAGPRVLRGPASESSRRLRAPHNGARRQRGDQRVGGLEPAGP